MEKAEGGVSGQFLELMGAVKMRVLLQSQGPSEQYWQMIPGKVKHGSSSVDSLSAGDAKIE